MPLHTPALLLTALLLSALTCSTNTAPAKPWPLQAIPSTSTNPSPSGPSPSGHTDSAIAHSRSRTAPHPGQATPVTDPATPRPGQTDPPPGQAGTAPGVVSGLPPPDLPLAQPNRFTWPLAPPHPVVRPFQPPATPYGPGHRGVDLGGEPDAPVLAAGDGTVVFAGTLAGRGVVSLAHAGGLRTTYEPLVALVSASQQVSRGEVIGHLTPGHESCVDAPACLHWGARRGAEYLDPLVLLSAGRVRLLPWDG